eukprot:13219-Heterococcus_DN1.PRE.2
MPLRCLHAGFAPAYSAPKSRIKQASRSSHVTVAAASRTQDIEHQLGRQEALRAAFGLLGTLTFAASAQAVIDDIAKPQVTSKVYLDVEIGGESCICASIMRCSAASDRCAGMSLLAAWCLACMARLVAV